MSKGKPKRSPYFPNTTKHAVPRDVTSPKTSSVIANRTGNSYGKRPAVKSSGK